MHRKLQRSAAEKRNEEASSRGFSGSFDFNRDEDYIGASGSND
jgi:hypothetical protein